MICFAAPIKKHGLFGFFLKSKCLIFSLFGTLPMINSCLL